MDVEPSFASVGALLGDPARANILNALMDGRAQTATELSFHAGVSPQTTSAHLAKLTGAGFLAVEVSGRYRHYRLASPAIAELLESLTPFAAQRPVPERRRSRELVRLRDARMCYDHLAGRLGVGLTAAMVARGYLEPAARDYGLTDAGRTFLRDLGVDVERLKRQRRSFARRCLDWSERLPHVGGAVGAAFAARCAELGWIAREPRGRRVHVTGAGAIALARILPGAALGLTPSDPPPPAAVGPPPAAPGVSP